MLGDQPFFQLNADTCYWIEGVKPNLEHMIDAWDDTRMDALLLIAETVKSIGYSGRGDFDMARDGGSPADRKKGSRPLPMPVRPSFIHACSTAHRTDPSP